MSAQTETPAVAPRTALSVNINKVALLRNSRPLGIPSIYRAARLCLDAGAQGITVHPRPDGRHIRDHDLTELADNLRPYPHAELNIEGNPFHNLMDIAQRFARQGLALHQLTFVPDSEEQATSDHGWKLAEDAERLAPVIAEAKALGLRVSLFMDADPEAMAAAKALGADRVELYTGPYAAHFDSRKKDATLARYVAAAQAAQAAGLEVNAGHDLNRENLTEFLQAVPGVREVSIGHALIADALEFGYQATVRAYLDCITRAGQPEPELLGRVVSQQATE